MTDPVITGSNALPLSYREETCTGLHGVFCKKELVMGPLAGRAVAVFFGTFFVALAVRGRMAFAFL